MVFITGSQNTNFRGSPPIEKQRYNNGILPTLQFNKDAASTNHESLILMPTNKLILKFTLRPDMSANRVNTARKARTFAQLFSPIKSVSSANCKWDTTTEFDVPTPYPLYKLFSTTECIKTFSPSATNKNKKGERGSPWRRPRCKGNSYVGLPFTIIEAVAVLTHYFIHFLHNTGNAILFITVSK